MLYGRSSIERYVARIMGKEGARKLHAVMMSLNGNAVGAPVLKQHARITAPPGLTAPLGGVRDVETVVDVTGNTTAAHQTYVEEEVLDPIYEMAPGLSTGGVGGMPVTANRGVLYPVDLSGNGGGGKRGV